MKRPMRPVIAMLLCLTMLFSVASTGIVYAEESADFTVDSPKVNYLNAPLGLDSNPKFSWKMDSDYIGAAQSAYEIVVKDNRQEIVWDSGKVHSSDSVGVPYAGQELAPETDYTWNVTVWNEAGKSASVQSTFSTGLNGNWEGACWIHPEAEGDAAPMLRTEHPLKGDVASAQLYISALGTYEAYINGNPVHLVHPDGSEEDLVLAPGWTNYHSYVNYQAYDVTSYISGDVLVLGAILGNGWYNGAAPGTNGIYAKDAGEEDVCELALLAKLVVSYHDGSRDVIVTDTDHWRSYGDGPLQFNEIFDGEVYDANIADQMEGWSEPGFDTSAWSSVSELEYYGTVEPSNGAGYAYFDETITQYPQNSEDSFLYSEVNESVANGGTSELEWGEVVRRSVDVNGDIAIQPGETLILDMGQNTSGVMEIEVSGEAGARVQLRHAEMLNDGKSNPKDETGGSDGPKGTLYRRAFNGGGGYAEQTDVYVMNEDDVQVYRPQFVYHGYRYVEITADRPITLHRAETHVITSAVNRTGSLETSDADVNQLASNIQWGERSNYTTVTTDCNNRAERIGWCGDAQIFAETALYNFDIAAFSENYMAIMKDHYERSGGSFAAVMPIPYEAESAEAISGWTDVGILLPWALYQQTGDLSIIRDFYPYMEGYVEYVNENGYNPFVFGDWLAFSGASLDIMNAFYHIYIAQVMAKVSDELGKPDHAQKYQELSNTLSAQFMEQYVDADGNVLSGGADTVDNAQTALLWALKLGLYKDEAQRDVYIANLLKSIRNEDQSVCADCAENTLQVGFLGVNVILPVLTEIGCADVAYDLLLQDAMPSWLYAVKVGATTTWERWNSYSSEDSFGNSGMNSFNHFSYGSCGEWMFEYMAGIQKDEANPGFKNTILQPIIDESGRITHASGRYDSYYGTIESAWTATGGSLTTYSAVVPGNTTATLYLPVEADAVAIGTSGVTYTGDDIRYGTICARFELQAGGYDFVIKDGVVTVTAKNGYIDDNAAVKSATAPESAQVNEEFVVTVVTSKEVADVRLYNTNGLAIGRKDISVTENDDGTRTWRITVALSTVGEGRVLQVMTRNASGILTNSGVSVALDITSILPALNSFELPDSAVVNRTFLVKASTDLNATDIAVYNENGMKMGVRNLSYKIVDNQKIWTGVMAIGTKGDRTFTAYAVNRYGEKSNVPLSDFISVKAFA